MRRTSALHALALASALLACSPARAAERVPDEVTFRRAAHLWRSGDVRSAVRALESIDFASTAADSARVHPRAALLLVAGAMRLGDSAKLNAALERANALPADAPESKWIAALAALSRGSIGVDELSSVLQSWSEACALEASGADASAIWSALASKEGDSPFERELVAAAKLRAATDALARGESVEGDLEKLSRDSASSRRALRMRARLALDAGDSTAARAFLAEASSGSLDTAQDREVALALAGLALDEARWDDAHRELGAIEGAWEREARATETFAAKGLDAPIDWKNWLRTREGAGVVRLEADPMTRALDVALAEALTPGPRDGAVGGAPLSPPPPPLFTLAAPDAAFGFTLPAPDSTLAAQASRLADDRDAARADVLEKRSALEDARADVVRRLGYLDRGAAGTDREIAELRALLARIDGLLASTDGELARLASLRDEEIRRIEERTTRFLKLCEENLVIARAIRHWRVEGPNASRPEILAPGVPAPNEILEQEIALADTLRHWIDGFAALMPELVRRSHAEIWEPRVKDGPEALAAEARARIAWAERVRSSIDSSQVAIGDPKRLRPLEDAIDVATGTLARLDEAERAARTTAFTDAIERARLAHAAEGEGIAFSIAIASHERAVAAATELARGTSGVSGAFAATSNETEARERLARFLETYPDSRARGEIRYRLADLEILRAREAFREKMASFLGTSESAPRATAALAPFVDDEPALALYRAILEEDQDYAHRDAVLYQAGMMLSDQGDPAARPLLDELLALHPNSAFRGHAALRLGDDDFEAHDLATAAAHFETAATAGDPEVASIALYKLGWVHFNRDAFDEASAAFLGLLDLYESNPDALALTDLRREGEESLVQSLARADGAGTFTALFGSEAHRSFDARVLGGLAGSLLSFNRYDDAAACDSLLLARHPEAPEALDTARHFVATLEEASQIQRALEARLALAPRFTMGSDWSKAAPSDSLRDAGDTFARIATETVALERHAAARASHANADWEGALALHERLLEGWPSDATKARTSFLAGEAAAALGRHDLALERFATASADTGALAVDASWQLVAVRDARYESARASSPPADGEAKELTAEIDRFVLARGSDPRVLEALWRKGDLCVRHGRLDDAAVAYADFLERAPHDKRAPDAARAAAKALFDANRFADAGNAFERAAQIARGAGVDSLAASLEPLVPLCHFKQAEAAEADSTNPEAGRLFELVAQRWPSYEHSDRALYRAGLAYGRAGEETDAVRAWNALLEEHPKSELARDAHLQIATTWKVAERPAAAARAYERFSETYVDDPAAQDALLEAADLLAVAKDEPGADAVRTKYLERFPDDLDAAFAILGTRAAKELDSVGPDLPLATLTKKPASSLARYLALAKKHPDLAAPVILAEVAYLEGEGVRRGYEAARLTQPIGPALAAKKKLLESVLAEYRQCAELGVEPWSLAGAFRIGESLVNFGEALRESERPADLSGDDLAAYEEVLDRQSWEFFDRGEETWTELVKAAKPESDEAKTWIAKTREELWPRVAKRFVHRPEFVYPLIAADPPKDGVPTTLSQKGGATHGSGS